LHCPNTEEMVHHFLLECPQYRLERNLLITTLGRDASSIPFLLTEEDAMLPLARFIDATERLKATFGEVSRIK
jgi:hypothetical protein